MNEVWTGEDPDAGFRERSCQIGSLFSGRDDGVRGGGLDARVCQREADIFIRPWKATPLLRYSSIFTLQEHQRVSPLESR